MAETQSVTLNCTQCATPAALFSPDTPRGLVGRYEWLAGGARVRYPESPLWEVRCAAHQEGMTQNPYPREGA